MANIERAVIEAARPSLANMAHTLINPAVTDNFGLNRHCATGAILLKVNMLGYYMKIGNVIF